MKANRACLVRHRGYPSDARIDNQIRILLRSGFAVDVLCTHERGKPLVSLENGARIIRLPAIKRLRGSLLRYFFEYCTFMIESSLALTLLFLLRRYQLIQICTLPDFLVFVALIPRQFGARILLDLRECSPEQYQIKYRTPHASKAVRLLTSIEQSSIRFADMALTCTEQMKAAFVRRGANPAGIEVMHNVANSEHFYSLCPPVVLSTDNSQFDIVVHGTITPRYGHSTLIGAMRLLLQKVPTARNSRSWAMVSFAPIWSRRSDDMDWNTLLPSQVSCLLTS